jgi:orotidine-5'-phosphate decarboxylase
MRAGADYLIVGREITMAPDPAEAAERLLFSKEVGITFRVCFPIALF